MITTQTLLDAVRTMQRIPSDYRLARELGVTDNTVGNWRHGRSRPDDEMAVRLAKLAMLSPAEVLTALHAERASDPGMRALWQAISRQLGRAGSTAAAVILSLWIGGGPDAGALAATHGNAGKAPVHNAFVESIH